MSNFPTDSEVLTAAKLARAVYDDPCDYQLYQRDGTTWLAIEGSDELIDWRRNFEFLLTSSDTHLGFANYATLLMAQMLASGVVLDPTHRVIITGHSLGGAVASIIAAHLQDHIPDLHLVTFGSPRPGGSRFSKRLKLPHHRYVHGDDIVPHLPSRLLGFRHTTVAMPLPIPRDSALMGIADHAMDGYVMALAGGGGRS
jgi:pimeloyl-ACP methyl ester carboxylesterase